jgi:hypothetical protein
MMGERDGVTKTFGVNQFLHKSNDVLMFFFSVFQTLVMSSLEPITTALMIMEKH